MDTIYFEPNQPIINICTHCGRGNIKNNMIIYTYVCESCKNEKLNVKNNTQENVKNCECIIF